MFRKYVCVCAGYFPGLTQIRCHADSGRSPLFSIDGPWLSCYDTPQRPSEGPSNYHRDTATTKNNVYAMYGKVFRKQSINQYE